MPRKLLSSSADVMPASNKAIGKRLNRKRKATPALAKPRKPDHQIDAKGLITTKLTPPDTSSKPSKQDMILSLLHQAEGASIAQIMTATGWQAHSVRGFLSGTVRKKFGLSLISEKIDGHRHYRIDSGNA